VISKHHLFLAPERTEGRNPHHHIPSGEGFRMQTSHCEPLPLVLRRNELLALLPTRILEG